MAKTVMFSLESDTNIAIFYVFKKYVVVDYLWYRQKVEHSYTDASGYDVIDEWGRLAPDPGRWPSSVGGKGFTEVAKKVHQMGLKFGIHVMRGLSFQAFNASTPILDIDTVFTLFFLSDCGNNHFPFYFNSHAISIH